ncbi:AAA family ATPase [Mycolicibacterium fortuitum]|uniref:AAA family ATPase n=1 Tax=Mycolicibacterium fortuitum TaxID=1766 RepID=UPI0007EC0A2A|nr:AAA family ATPase [Mycolicibacterium fortuitum]NOQ61648.1 AAA family ATPase [Mycolicibacterium fortuitum]OBG10203.1 LuxR family transcriptional regulator [Mycolicibacterium fortuitum]OBI75639.1 LuxR family transcriptional regulator [Mycolicibacterium fortuitum]
MGAGSWSVHIPVATVGRPAAGLGTVPRPGVTRILRERTGLVVVAAPAGYGKTTAVAQWDDTDERPFAWVRFDNLDNDPAHLLLHLATALGQVKPVDPAVSAYLQGAGRAQTQLVPAFVKALEDSGPTVLVLDDVHELSARAALDTLRAVVDLAPESATIALVGRQKPPLELARRRLEGRVVEVGIAELQLSGAEATAAFAAVGGHADKSTIERVLDKCEGWAAGVVMAALALRDGAPAEAVTGRHRLVANYLVEEVLSALDPETATFLTESATLDRFSADELDGLLGRTDSAAMIEAITRSGNIFLISLDAQGVWYRYHQLFGDLLRARLRDREPDRFRQLAARAADRLAQTGDIDGALVQALAAGDHARAAALVGIDAVRLGFDGRAGVLARRLSLLDEQTFTDYPDAAIARAWLGVMTGNAELIQRSLLTAAAADSGQQLADGTPSVEVAAALIGSLLGVGGVSEVIRHAETVCGAGDHLVNPWWGAATTMKGAALSMLGESGPARVALESALPVIEDLPGFQAAALAHLAALDLGNGDLSAAVARTDTARSIVDARDLSDMVPMVVVYAVDALVRGRRGDVAGARSAVRATERLLDRLGDLSARTALMAHVLVAATAVEVDDTELCERHLSEAQRAHRREPDAVAMGLWLDRIRTLSVARSARGARPSLTTAELRLLPHLATHLSLQRIADELVIGRETVKSQAKSIYRKLDVSSRAAAVAEAERLGLLSGNARAAARTAATSETPRSTPR